MHIMLVIIILSNDNIIHCVAQNVSEAGVRIMYYIFKGKNNDRIFIIISYSAAAAQFFDLIYVLKIISGKTRT